MGILLGKIGREPGPGDAGCPRKHVADLRKEFLPALMCKKLAGGTTLHRASIGERIAKWIGCRSLIAVEVVVVGQPLGIGLAHMGWKDGLAVAFAERQRLLHQQPGQCLREFLDAKKWAARCPRGDLGERAARERTEAVFAQEQATGAD